MASQQRCTLLSRFETLRKEIRAKFIRAHQVLDETETELLRQLREFEAKYEWEVIADQIHQLSTSKEQLIETLSGNRNQHILGQSLAPIDVQIKELKSMLEQIDTVDFEWDSELESKLKKIGKLNEIGERVAHNLSHPVELTYGINEISGVKIESLIEETIESDETQNSVTSEYTPVDLQDEWNEIFDACVRRKVSQDPPDYKSKGSPVKLACYRRDIPNSKLGSFAYLNSIEIHPITENIYVSDGEFNDVKVFNKSFKLLFVFNGNMNVPEAICIMQNKVYITQLCSHCINTYTVEGRFLQSVGGSGNNQLEFDFPCGLAVSNSRNIIYICDRGNDRVQCLNLNQTFHSFINDISTPLDIKLTPHTIVLLTSNFLCFYNASHQLVRNLIQCGVGILAVKPMYFCLDKFENILMTDSAAHCVLVFSNQGELMHRFGKKGENPGEFMQPSGIALDSEGRVIVATDNPKYLLQIF